MKILCLFVMMLWAVASCACYGINTSGCCSYHGGIDHCEDGKVICRDGEISGCGTGEKEDD